MDAMVETLVAAIHVVLHRRREAQKSRLADPTPCDGSGNTTRYATIPVLGIIRQASVRSWTE